MFVEATAGLACAPLSEDDDGMSLFHFVQYLSMFSGELVLGFYVLL